ncbi:MAG: alkaline phosphatase D family protein, partial [Planctomycetota bacterium]
WLPQLIRRGVLPAQVSIAELLSQKTQVADLPGASLKLEEFASSGQLLQYRPQKPADQGETVIHLVLDSQAWETPDQAFAAELIQQRITVMPNQAHAFYRFSMSAWRHENNPNVKKQNQLARRFYLLGETIEQRALHELLSVMLRISQETDIELSLAATDRESAIMTLAALYANAEEPMRDIKTVYLNRNPQDGQLAGNLLGLSQICTVASLQLALERAAVVRSAPIAATSPQVLVDSSSEPRQANGMRIVEVSERTAKIWVRATRYDLPNLGDLPEVEFEKKIGRTSSGAILPEQGVDGLRFAVPGVPARVRAGVRAAGQSEYNYSAWTEVDASSDYSSIAEFGDLRPGTRYSVRTQVQSPESGSVHTLTGSFKTLPAPDSASSFKLAVSTCQGFPDRDGPHGFDMYRTILRRNTDAFVMAGDVVYYDRLARSNELAYYHWQRTYSLPTLVEFHRRVPSYFLKDDHDTYVNDSWPGEKREFTDDFEFTDGQRIFIQETGLPSPAYRTVRIARDLQVWMMEGRDFRSPNTKKDGPSKTIWGAEQKAWLTQTLKNSDAKFKVIISPTPIVGPDRKGKKDN